MQSQVVPSSLPNLYFKVVVAIYSTSEMPEKTERRVAEFMQSRVWLFCHNTTDINMYVYQFTKRLHRLSNINFDFI